jgi:hypothetical protein
MIPFCGLVEEFILEFERGRKNCDVTHRGAGALRI